MIKGCVGFSRIHGHLCGDMILVRGKETVHVRLPLPIYFVMAHLSRRKNILGKFLFKKATYEINPIVN